MESNSQPDKPLKNEYGNFCPYCHGVNVKKCPVPDELGQESVNLYRCLTCEKIYEGIPTETFKGTLT